MNQFPLIFWGADAVGRSLIRQVRSSPAASWRLDPPQVFEPGTEPLRGFRDLLARVQEDKQSRGAVARPHIVIVVAAFLGEADAMVDLLKRAHAVLEMALPGDPLLTLVTLLPPLHAADKERIQAFRFFVGLEGVVGTLPLLRSLLVLQLRQNPAETSGPVEDAAPVLAEVLSRALADPEVQRLVSRVGAFAVGNARTVAGSKCCYSTLGCLRLVHPAGDCLRHLRARFHREVFHGAFLHEPSVGDEERSAIQARIDALIQRLLDRSRSSLPAGGRVSAVALGGLLDAGQSQACMLAFDKEVDEVLTQDAPHLQDARTTLEAEIRADLHEFVATSPGRLAGVRHYLAALHGQRLDPGPTADPPQPSGVNQFRQRFCVDPFGSLLLNALEPQLKTAPGEGGASLPPKEENEVGSDWLARADAADAMLQEMEPGARSPARLFGTSFRCLRTHLESEGGDFSDARRLVDELAVAFVNETNALHDLVTRTRESRARTEDDLHTLHARHTWLRRVLAPPKAFREERARLENEVRHCDAELADLRSAFPAMHRQFVHLLNDAVLPYILRTQVAERLAEEVQHAADHYSDFVETVAHSLEAEWQQARIPQEHTPTSSSVLTPEKADTLYRRALAGMGLPHLAEEVLRFGAGKAIGPDGRPLLYSHCRSFTDHYFAGPQPLLDRIRDYSADLFGPVALLDVLDILELHGKEEAHATLADARERTSRFVQFASAMVARVENEGALQAHFLARTAGSSESRLAAEYGHLFQPHVEFLDSGDPYAVDITCLIVGFPAFLMHPLHAGRTLALRDGYPGDEFSPHD